MDIMEKTIDLRIENTVGIDVYEFDYFISTINTCMRLFDEVGTLNEVIAKKANRDRVHRGVSSLVNYMFFMGKYTREYYKYTAVKTLYKAKGFLKRKKVNVVESELRGIILYSVFSLYWLFGGKGKKWTDDKLEETINKVKGYLYGKKRV